MSFVCYVIDIGTNSARLMLAEKENGVFRSCYKMLRTVRTGEGVHASGRLCEAAIQRTVAAMRDFREQIDKEHPQLPVFCFATSAVRDSENSADLQTAVKEAAGFDIRIISGEEEAEIGFLGAVPSGTGGIIDIGGGSTEFVIGENGAIRFRRSFQMGTVRCKEMFGDDADGIDRTIAYAKEMCRELPALSSVEFTGIGGTITSVAAMLMEMEEYDPRKIQGSRIPREDAEKLLEKLSSMTLEQRKTVKGLQPQRADVILSGMSVLIGAMRALDLKNILVSDADNLEGYAIKHKNAISP